MVKVAFLHPDLGIGGAERLVVDAAVALQTKGHGVQFVTSHHDSSHCFEETSNGTLSVTAVGDWLPRSLFGRCYALCAYVRMVYAALYLVVFSGIEYDVIFCDQISACIPMLRLLSRAKVLFYCHFPDQLLTKRDSTLKYLYRLPIDWLEEVSTGLAHVVVVNSKFTAAVFRQTFPTLRSLDPEVLYPSLVFDNFLHPADPPIGDLLPAFKTLFLSINRFERKKNLPLALESLAYLKTQLSSDRFAHVHMVVAGGYDNANAENKEHYLELLNLVDELELSDKVTFLRSFSDSDKVHLLEACTCLLYTPSNEHFGIVPIEAMFMRRPVIAVKSGGPLETIVDSETGFLCESQPADFSKVMMKFLVDPSLRDRMGEAGCERVRDNFSFSAFSEKLETIVAHLYRN